MPLPPRAPARQRLRAHSANAHDSTASVSPRRHRGGKHDAAPLISAPRKRRLRRVRSDNHAARVLTALVSIGEGTRGLRGTVLVEADHRTVGIAFAGPPREIRFNRAAESSGA